MALGEVKERGVGAVDFPVLHPEGFDQDVLCTKQGPAPILLTLRPGPGPQSLGFLGGLETIRQVLLLYLQLCQTQKRQKID